MYVDSKTTDDVAGGTSVWNAIGSAFSRHCAVGAEDRELVAGAAADVGHEQLPHAGLPSWRIGCSRPSQLLNEPFTRTPRADGAQTANAVPVTMSPNGVS